MIDLTEQLGHQVSVSAACRATGVPRSTLYRSRRPPSAEKRDRAPHPRPPRALSETEKDEAHTLLNGERFRDRAPMEVYAALLDEGRYVCSWRTMYRILDEHKEVRERRNQLRHPAYARPELLATGPNQLWSLGHHQAAGARQVDLLLPVRHARCVQPLCRGLDDRRATVGRLAEDLIAEACARQGIQPGELTLHADRGGAMKAKSVALLMADLGVRKTHSRPHVSDDNPYSEAQFKTLKYHPSYPGRFGSLEDARRWAQEFFPWYNQEHHHSGLGLLRSADVHYGRAEAILARREAVMQEAYEQHPERFVQGPPKLPALQVAVWINPPRNGAEGCHDRQEDVDRIPSPTKEGCGIIHLP